MAHNIEPVQYPTIEIQGTQYQIRFGLGALFRLEQLGISADSLAQFSKPSDEGGGLPAGKTIQTLCAVLSATLGTQPNGSWIPIGKSPEQVADMLTPADFAALLPVMQGGLAKASPAEKTGATLPAEQPHLIESNFG